MLTPLNIVSLDQGKAPARSEDEYYGGVAEWRAPRGLGRFLGWVRPTRLRADAAPGEALPPAVTCA